MSSTASRTYAIDHVQFFPTLAAYGVRTDSLSEALAVEGDGKYIIMELSGTNAALYAKSAYDNGIPSGARLDSITVHLKAAMSESTGILVESYGVRWGADDFQYELSPQDVVSFTNVIPSEKRFEIADWEAISAEFTGDLGGDLDVGYIGQYYLGLKALGANLSGFLAFDFMEVTYNFTLGSGVAFAAAPIVYDTTSYSAKVRATVGLVAGMFNSNYPLTCWFEFTPVDPTNADNDTIPIFTTPVQTFTSLESSGRNLAFYDTLPSPLDVQNPKTSLQPNTTYWVRGKAGLNGEVLVSGWTSFTTPLYDTVVL